MRKDCATKCYQIPVESKIFSTMKDEDESLNEEMPEIATRATDLHEITTKLD